MNKVHSDFFIPGGSLKPNAPSYIKRAADDELYTHIKNHDFCYVLTTRQMGKSSLMAKTAVKLRKDEWLTAIIDLTSIGGQEQNTDPKSWYYGILHQITREINKQLKREQQPLLAIKQWWQDNENISVVQRFSEYFEDILLANTEKPITIFFDEIDSTITLPFTDDFFAAIRACYNARANNEAYNRLGFVLLGVATPADLINDTRRTPFNIGQAIHLNDFSREEIQPLSDGFNGNTTANAIIDRIHYWTDGHPYLSQKIANLICDESIKNDLPKDTNSLVDKQINQHFLNPKATQNETNLKFVENRITQDKNHGTAMLKLYRQLYRQHDTDKTIPDKPLSPVYNGLKLSGLVKLDSNNNLQIRNQLYKTVFNELWIKRNLHKDRTVLKAVSAAAAVVIIAFVIWLELILPRTYIQILQTVIDDKPLAIEARKKLSRIPGYSKIANRLLAEFWERRALRKYAGDRDRMFLTMLQGLRNNTDKSYRQKLATLRFQGDSRLRKTLLRDKGKIEAMSKDWTKIATSQQQEISNVQSGKQEPEKKTIYSVIIWDAQTGEAVTPPLKHEGLITQVSFNTQGNRVATASNDHTARVWDTQTGEAVTPPLKHEGLVTQVSFNTQGNRVATASDDHTARIWDTQTGEAVTPPLKHEAEVTRVIFNSQGNLVATASWDHTARIWDAQTGEATTPPLQHKGENIQVSFNTEGNHAATASSDKTARIWNAQTGEPITPPLQHKNEVNQVIFNSQGSLVATASWDHTVLVWDTYTGKAITPPLQHDDLINHVSFNAQGNRVVTSSYDNTTRVWNAYTGKAITQPLRHERPVYQVSFNNQGNQVATVSGDDTARVWDVQTGGVTTSPFQHEDEIDQVSFNAQGNRIAMISGNNNVRVLNLQTGKTITLPHPNEDWIYKVSFNAQGDRIATVSNNNTARVWNAQTGKAVTPPLQHDARINHVSFNAQGNRVATASYDNTARVWDAQTGKAVTPPLQHDNWVNHVSFNAKGDHIATANNDNTVRIWDTKTGKSLTPPLQHTSPVYQVSFNAKGNWGATASLDGSVRIWDAQRGTSLIPPLKLKYSANQVSFSKNTKRLVTFRDDSFVNNMRLSEDNTRLVTTTDFWLRWYQLQEDKTGSLQATFIAARPLEAQFNPGSFNLKCIDERCDGVRIVMGFNTLSNPLQTLYFDGRDKEPLQGDVEVLLKDWSERLGIDPDTL